MIHSSKEFFKGEVEDTPETLSKYSHDASIFEIRPKLIVYPKDAEDIRNLIKWVSDTKDRSDDLSVTARSAGTDMTGGPLNNSIILDVTRHMNGIISVENGLVKVLPGTY